MEFKVLNKEKNRNDGASTSKSIRFETEVVLQPQPLPMASELPVINGDSNEIEILHVGASRSDRLRLGLLLIKKARLEKDCKNLEVINARLNQIFGPPEAVTEHQSNEAKLEIALQEIQRLKGEIENLTTKVTEMQANGIPVEIVFVPQGTSNEAASVTNEFVPIATFKKPAQRGISPYNGSELVGDDKLPSGHSSDTFQVDDRMDVDQDASTAAVEDKDSNKGGEIGPLPPQVIGNNDNLNQNLDNQQEMDVDSTPAGSNENVRSSTPTVAEPTPGPSGVKKRHECNVCELDFSTVEQLSRHLLSFKHLKKVSEVTNCKIQYPFWCELCEKGFTFADSLVLHKKTRLHKKKSTEQGIIVPTSYPYLCEICQVTFTLSNSLRKHMKSALHKKNEAKELIWEKVAGHSSNEFQNGDVIDVDQSQKTAAVQDDDRNEFGDSEPLPLQVTVNDQNFDNQQEIDVASNLPGSNENVIPSTPTVAEPTSGPSGIKKRHECNVCEVDFLYFTEFLKHLLSFKHRKKESEVTKRPIQYPFRCELCDEGFSQKKALKEHELHSLTHKRRSAEQGITVPVVDPHRCEVCDESFTRLSSLRYHNKTALHLKMVALKHQQAAATE